LVISTIERKPFVYDNYGELTWFSVELFEEIARKTWISYTYEVAETFSDMLLQVENSEVDAAIANISVTSSREKVMDFSYPMYDSGLQILVWVKSSSWILRSLLPLLLFFAVVHVVIKNYAAVLLNIPTSGILLSLWILAGWYIVINVSSQRAHAVEPIEYGSIPHNLLSRYTLWAARSTTMSAFLDRERIDYKDYKDFSLSLQALKDGKVEAIVWDAAVSKYYAQNEGKDNVSVVWNVFEPDKIAIAFPEDSPYLEKINKALLQIKEEWTYNELVEKYFWDTLY